MNIYYSGERSAYYQTWEELYIVQILFVFRLPVVLVGNNMHVRGFAGNVHIICAKTLWVNVHTETHNTLQNS